MTEAHAIVKCDVLPHLVKLERDTSSLYCVQDFLRIRDDYGANTQYLCMYLHVI